MFIRSLLAVTDPKLPRILKSNYVIPNPLKSCLRVSFGNTKCNLQPDTPGLPQWHSLSHYHRFRLA